MARNERPNEQHASEVTLSRTLGPFTVTMIGVGGMIGAGIFALTGAAAGVAGPASGAGLSLERPGHHPHGHGLRRTRISLPTGRRRFRMGEGGARRSTGIPGRMDELVCLHCRRCTLRPHLRALRQRALDHGRSTHARAECPSHDAGCSWS